MKLSVFSTPASKQSTKKLTKQVHKATVAAGKAPRLELGVVGMSIGQEQSTGDTSRISEETDKQPRSMSDLLDLLYDTNEELIDFEGSGNIYNIRGSLARSRKDGGITYEVDLLAAFEDALTILRVHDGSNEGGTKMQRLSMGIVRFRKSLEATTTPLNDAIDTIHALRDEGFPGSKLFGEAMKAVTAIQMAESRLKFHIEAVALFYSQIIAIAEAPLKDEYAKSVRAAFLKYMGLASNLRESVPTPDGVL